MPEIAKTCNCNIETTIVLIDTSSYFEQSFIPLLVSVSYSTTFPIHPATEFNRMGKQSTRRNNVFSRIRSSISSAFAERIRSSSPSFPANYLSTSASPTRWNSHLGSIFASTETLVETLSTSSVSSRFDSVEAISAVTSHKRMGYRGALAAAAGVFVF
ncbi:hypothetical protein CC80DRAFT_532532 [Byssothecium circinans]|uniref:Uncharacterized protein n=1 Tax=Byssothecium circinans TaxID=147558 RepID=A0A6A5UB24_9PLEO|nr:hypothetical protein CC80DRAFT_532532 [Byssothecium circinans]